MHECRYGTPAWQQVGALMWRESILTGRNRRAQIYRYVQMTVLAVMVATLFVRGAVSTTETVRVCTACFWALTPSLTQRYDATSLISSPVK